ncbi:CoA pyrophosphatase [Sphingomonas nostoxanthinifaciens]|uniref:CoA pyrophosphatase n=1 Tax=Sphingomonas nostoxanthinifaciens TaxID=2872652 RepID=UPI001CC1E959|nr:CoA pyrophosphatase [Sphingomonas nostoxanthinifaciens]UAK22982.1 CoA pyrophosphatase [Sphingomonas nostoxanthinifaciens]
MTMLAQRLRTALDDAAHRVVMGRDDLDFPGEPTPAAVLIAITDRPEPGVILTLRQPHLRRHAGQISFPGGRIDPGDPSPVAAALREAQEEIALDPASVEIVGTADPYLTGSGYAIVPVVGVVPPDLALMPSEAEVAAVFEVPLAFVTAAANQVERSATFGGRERRFHEIQWQERRIWGITAALIVDLSQRLANFA